MDKLPKIVRFEKVDYQLLLAYYKHKYNKLIKPVQRRNGKSISENILCPKCGAPHQYIYDNNSTRQTAHALKEVHGINISHTMVANYALTAAAVINPFVDTFDYKPSNILSADETYIKVKGIKHYV